jgi:phosphoenolpyruvate carboxykinase (ATP)
LEIPISCPGVSTEILHPRNTWPDKRKYESSAKKLARLFVKNFEKFGKMPKDIQRAGPTV